MSRDEWSKGELGVHPQSQWGVLGLGVVQGVGSLLLGKEEVVDEWGPVQWGVVQKVPGVGGPVE